MILYYIRHGDPIYHPDSLTPLGKREAEAVAKRLAVYGVDGIYSSTSNRAIETAAPLAELLKKELRAMGILDEGRQAAGGGTKPPQQKQGDGSVAVDVSMARTQNEAQELIAKQLMQQGLINGSKEFQTAMDQAWKDNNVQALPMQ